MSNLIITVISIALVAVAALMGAYYGGSAFMDGQATAQANQLINTARQISSAWQLYAVNNGGSFVQPSQTCGSPMYDLIPAYLADWPSVDGLATNIQTIKITSSGSYANCDADANFLQFNGILEKACAQINKIANGSISIPENPSLMTMYNSAQPMLCHHSGGAYYFMYRVF